MFVFIYQQSRVWQYYLRLSVIFEYVVFWNTISHMFNRGIPNCLKHSNDEGGGVADFIDAGGWGVCRRIIPDFVRHGHTHKPYNIITFPFKSH